MVGPRAAAGPPEAVVLVAPCVGIAHIAYSISVPGICGRFWTCLVGSSTAGACQLSLLVPDSTLSTG